MSDPTDEELAERVAALEETLEELRRELEPSRGPMGLPRPPAPREVLRFTDEFAIPAAIAVLEANIRTLELLRAVLRGARGAPSEDEVRNRAASIGQTTVERLDRALADLQAEIQEADLPQNDEARSLLSEAKSLNREIRDALSDGRPLEDGTGVDTGAGDRPREDPDTTIADEPTVEDTTTVEIDVDAELESIKDELDETDEDGGSTADDGDDRDGPER